MSRRANRYKNTIKTQNTENKRRLKAEKENRKNESGRKPTEAKTERKLTKKKQNRN